MFRVATVIFALSLPAGALAQSGHHHHDMAAGPSTSTPAAPTQPGQGAFAAIQEIVEILEADPKTDWSKVDIGALRQHLIDMNNVTLRAMVQSSPIDGGVKFAADGDGEVKQSIQRMVMAHAAIMNGVGGWKITAAETEQPLDIALNVIAVVSTAALFLAHEDPFVREAVCAKIKFCPTITNAKAWNKIFYDLAAGALVSLIFYVLVVRVPDYQRRRRYKKSFAHQYQNFREDCIGLMLGVAHRTYEWGKQRDLLDQKNSEHTSMSGLRAIKLVGIGF